MTITVKEAKQAWESPDGKIKIYDLVDQDGNAWSTFSHKIGNGIGQAFDVEVYQKKGKTYLRLPVDPNSPYANKAPTSSPEAVQPTPYLEVLIQRLEKAVERVEALEGTAGYTLTEIPEEEPAQGTVTNNEIEDFLG